MKYIKYILIITILVRLFSPAVQVEAVPCTAPNTPPGCTSYYLLAPLPGADGQPIASVNPETGFGSYLNMMIKIFIGLCAVLAVVMIVIGGIEVMTTELAHTKQAGKERISNALLGLLIALGAYALLFTINPDLLKSDINPPATTGTPTNQPTNINLGPTPTGGIINTNSPENFNISQ